MVTFRRSGRLPLMILCPGPLPYISVVKGNISVAHSGDFPETCKNNLWFILFILLSVSHSTHNTYENTTTIKTGFLYPWGAQEVTTLLSISVLTLDEPLAWRVCLLMKSLEFHSHINHSYTTGRRRKEREGRKRRVKWKEGGSWKVETAWYNHCSIQYKLWWLLLIYLWAVSFNFFFINAK